MGNLLTIFACLALGIAFRASRRGMRAPEGMVRALNHFIIYAALPAVTLVHVHAARSLSFFPVAMAWIVATAALAAAALVANAMGWNRRTCGALVLAAGFGNTSFVGYPLVEALYGREGLRTAVLTDQPGTFLALSTLGLVVAAWCARSGSGPRVSVAGIARRVVSFPPFLALLVALALRPLAYPAALEAMLERIAATLVPLALVSVGLQLSVNARFLKRNVKTLMAGLVYKLVLAPSLIFFLYVVVARARGPEIQVTIAEAAMAPMITGAIVATEYGLEPELASLLVGVGIPLSLLTVPLWAWLIRNV